MANRTDVLAKSVHGNDPQLLVERITRDRIYASRYWKERCFGLNAATLVDEATKLDHVGGLHGGARVATDFICLLLKMLQLSVEPDIAIEYMKQDEFKYLRVLGAIYWRIVARPADIHKQLEPLLLDMRKLAVRVVDGGWKIIHVDEFVDGLLRDEQSIGITLPVTPSRMQLERNQLLAPRESPLVGMGMVTRDEISAIARGRAPMPGAPPGYSDGIEGQGAGGSGDRVPPTLPSGSGAASGSSIDGAAASSELAPASAPMDGAGAPGTGAGRAGAGAGPGAGADHQAGQVRGRSMSEDEDGHGGSIRGDRDMDMDRPSKRARVEAGSSGGGAGGDAGAAFGQAAMDASGELGAPMGPPSAGTGAGTGTGKGMGMDGGQEVEAMSQAEGGDGHGRGKKHDKDNSKSKSKSKKKKKKGKKAPLAIPGIKLGGGSSVTSGEASSGAAGAPLSEVEEANALRAKLGIKPLRE